MEQPDYKAKYHELVKNFFPLLMVANAAKSYLEKPYVTGFEILCSTIEVANQAGIFYGSFYREYQLLRLKGFFYKVICPPFYRFCCCFNIAVPTYYDDRDILIVLFDYFE